MPTEKATESAITVVVTLAKSIFQLITGVSAFRYPSGEAKILFILITSAIMLTINMPASERLENTMNAVVIASFTRWKYPRDIEIILNRITMPNAVALRLRL
jgi:hypothetical protein